MILENILVQNHFPINYAKQNQNQIDIESKKFYDRRNIYGKKMNNVCLKI